MLSKDALAEAPLNQLGPDCLLSLPTAPELFHLFTTRSAAIKSVLLDQTVISGIGNYLADEVLYQRYSI